MKSAFSDNVQQSSPTRNYDLKVIDKYLDFLGYGEINPHFTFAFFDKKSERMLPNGLSTQYLSKEGILNLVPSLNTTNFTLHVCLNETFPAGRKNHDVKAPRVLCVDIDRWSTVEELKVFIQYKAQAITITSQHFDKMKIHAYWKLAPGMSIQQWENFQLGLSEIFNGDVNLAAINKTVRVPGVERLSKDGSLYTPQFNTGTVTPLSIEEVFELFPSIVFSSRLAKKKSREVESLTQKYFDEAFTYNTCGPSVIEPKEFLKMIDFHGRNQTLFNLCKKYLEGQIKVPRTKWDKEDSEKLTKETISFAKKINDDFNQVGREMLARDEFAKTVNSVLRRTLSYVVGQIRKEISLLED